MSYKTIHACANDAALTARVTACLAQEGVEAPVAAVGNYMYAVASAADIEAAYASALAADNPDPGGDESVISDQMILSTVQANPPAAP
jgi:hypothetical protein